MLYEINPDLSKVIQSSWFTSESGTYIYVKVKELVHAEKHLIITRDSDEITVVTDLANLVLLGDYERNPENWKLLNIKCGNPFYCKGFLAVIAASFAKKGIDITLTSTYTNDYIMVQENNLTKAIFVLEEMGFQKKDTRKKL